jgi:hypothetical protein
MSVLGHSRRLDPEPPTSDLPRKTDIVRPARHVSKVPGADLLLLDDLIGAAE